MAGSDDDPTRLGGDSTDLDRAARALELRNPDEGLPLFDRIVNGAAEAFGAALLVSVFLIVFLNALGRYVTGHALPWGEEVVIGVVPWISVTGLFLSVRRRELIRITYFEERLSPRTRTVITFAAQILCCGLFGLIAFLALGHVTRFGGDMTPVLGLPKGLTYSAMLVGGVAVALAFLFHIGRAVLAARSGEARR